MLKFKVFNMNEFIKLSAKFDRIRTFNSCIVPAFWYFCQEK